MSFPRLSLGVATCADAPALQRTLDSVFAQERSFDQIAVADDQSSVALSELLQTYQDRLQVFPVCRNLTPAQQWNEMAPHLTGDWISLLTTDDCARPNFARAVEQTVLASPGAAILRAGWMRLRIGDKPGEMYTLHSVRAVVKPADALFEQRFGPKGSFSACAIRRDIWEQAGWFPQETPLLGDWAMWLLAGALGDTVRSREVIADRLVQQQSTIMEAERKMAEVQEMYLIYRDILPRAANWAALQKPTWISSASRKRFRDVVIAASNKFGPTLRGPLADALRPWARSVDQGSLLHRLEAGDRIRDYNFARKMKPALKRVMLAVR